jgi:hypothetical protein
MTVSGRAIRAAALLACLLLPPSPPARAQDAEQVLTPPLLSRNIPIANPMSGPYRSYGQNPKTLAAEPSTRGDPWPVTSVDTYERFSWHSLERDGPGQYNFALIDTMLNAVPPGQRFGFRIMPLNPQTPGNTNVTTGADGYPVYADVPAYFETGAHGWLLPVDPKDPTEGHYFVPDWNDPAYLERITALLNALGDRYDGDPRMAWVDIGLYGSWGEWHTSGLPDSADYTHGIPYAPTAPYYAINQQAYLANTGHAGAYAAGTVATKTAIVAAHVQAFPTTQLVMLSDDGDAVCYALGLPDQQAHIGLRRDSLGSSVNSFYYQFPNALPDCDSAGDVGRILNRWRTAPLVTEPFGNGSSPTFPCQTFETYLPADASHAFNCSVAAYGGKVPNFCVDAEVLQSHVANINNGFLCAVPWAVLPGAEQNAFRVAALDSGYRFAPVRITVHAGDAPDTIVVRTEWHNIGVTPAYNAWNVEFSLRREDGDGRKALRWISDVDLRQVAPTGTTPFVVDDVVHLRGRAHPGRYALRIVVRDPAGYLNPMQLGLEGQEPDGGYELGALVVAR